MTENEISGQVVDAAVRVHSALGPGLLESVYETCLAYELAKRDIGVERQKELPVIYDGHRMDGGFRVDMVVGGAVVVEIKAVETILPVHAAQLLTYLKLGGYRLGLLLNFNATLMRQGIKRIVLDL